MIRKLFLAGLTVVGLAVPLLWAPAAEAHPPVVVYRSPVYEVLYRGHHHWHYYGTYYSRYEADRAARHLAWRGFQARVDIR
jgi:hypothetical protein